MPASGSSVLTWGHRALTSAVETGSRLLARAAIFGGDRRPLERRSAEPARTRRFVRPSAATADDPAFAYGSRSVCERDGLRGAAAALCPRTCRDGVTDPGHGAALGPRAGDSGCRSGTDPSVAYGAVPDTGGMVPQL